MEIVSDLPKVWVVSKEQKWNLYSGSLDISFVYRKPDL